MQEIMARLSTAGLGVPKSQMIKRIYRSLSLKCKH